MKTVPSLASSVPTVPTYVGTQKMADFCAFQPPVPTVPTLYVYIITEGGSGGDGRSAAESLGNRWEQGTVFRKPAENRQKCRSILPFPPQTVPTSGPDLAA